MLIDTQMQFCEDQALTTTADATNVIDLQAAKRELGDGEPVWLVIDVGTALASGTSVNFGLYTDDNAAMSSDTLLYQTGVLTTAAINALGRIAIPLGIISTAFERYLSLTFTIVGTYNAGTITAWLGTQPENWKAPASGLTFG